MREALWRIRWMLLVSCHLLLTSVLETKPTEMHLFKLMVCSDGEKLYLRLSE